MGILDIKCVDKEPTGSILSFRGFRDLFHRNINETLSYYDGVEKHESNEITFFIASKDGKKCILNKKGEIQGNFYDEIEIKSFNKNLFFIASEDGKKCVLNKKGEIQGGFYDNVELSGELYAYTGGKRKTFIYLTGIDKFIGPFDKLPVTDSIVLGYRTVIDEGKYGICSQSTGEYIIPMDYNDIKIILNNGKMFNRFKGAFKVKLGEKYGLYLIEGNNSTQVLNSEYDDITCIYDNGYNKNRFKGAFKVKSGEKYGLYLIEGNNSTQVLNSKYDDITYLGDSKYELTTGSETKVVKIPNN